jgi:hypothetical protein
MAAGSTNNRLRLDMETRIAKACRRLVLELICDLHDDVGGTSDQETGGPSLVGQVKGAIRR